MKVWAGNSTTQATTALEQPPNAAISTRSLDNATNAGRTHILSISPSAVYIRDSDNDDDQSNDDNDDDQSNDDNDSEPTYAAAVTTP